MNQQMRAVLVQIKDLIILLLEKIGKVIGVLSEENPLLEALIRGINYGRLRGI